MGDPGVVVGPARGDVTLQRVGHEAILHDAGTGRAHVINASAARVWELCDGRSMNDLVRAFAEPYGRSADDVRDDVARVIQDFRALGLLTEPP